MFALRLINLIGVNWRRFKYKGGDDSIVLKYITNPIYTKLVQLFPAWVAPNLITMTGLSFQIAAFCIMVWHCPTLSEQAPPWVCLVAAAAGIGYQAMDAMDGKQARLHGGGSPYGMVFDHGCDAVNTPLLVVTCWMACQGGEFHHTHITHTQLSASMYIVPCYRLKLK